MNRLIAVVCAAMLGFGGASSGQQPATPVNARSAGEQAPRAAAGADVGETLILLQHQLREVITKRDLAAKYGACNRASRIFRGIAPVLSPEQRVTWRSRIAGAFRRLPLPETVVGVSELKFHRVSSARGFVYVSEAVTTGQYAAFLTDRGIPVDRIRDQFYETPFLQAAETVTASDRAAPISGLSYRAASAYRDWLAAKEGAGVHLPSLWELPSGLRRSLWIADAWKESNQERAELYRMYGGDPVTLLDHGKPVAEFAEAASPGVQLHLAMSADDARRFQLRTTAKQEAVK